MLWQFCAFAAKGGLNINDSQAKLADYPLFNLSIILEFAYY
jgi:hypothetical protein